MFTKQRLLAELNPTPKHDRAILTRHYTDHDVTYGIKFPLGKRNVRVIIGADLAEANKVRRAITQLLAGHKTDCIPALKIWQSANR